MAFFRTRSLSLALFGYLLFDVLLLGKTGVTSVTNDFGFHFVVHPSWQRVSPGEHVTMNCVTNLAPDKIIWQHNHRSIKESKHSNLSNSSNGKMDPGVLILSNGFNGSSLMSKISLDITEAKDQQGLYQCVAVVGSIGLSSLPGRIEVAYLKQYAQKPSHRHLEIEVGNAFRVPCQRPDSLPQAILQYYRNRTLLDLANKRYHTTASGDLIVLNMDHSTVGEYSCKALNSHLDDIAEYPLKTSVYSKVKKSNHLTKAPQLVAFDSVITALAGHRVELLCVSVGSAPTYLLWSRRKSDIVYREVEDESSLSMVIGEVSVSDEGVYRCYGNNSFGSSSVHVTMFVQEPPYLIIGPEKLSVSEEADANMQCIFGGQPTPTVAWVFNGKLLSKSSNILANGNTLNLKFVEKNQSGVYQCFGFNPFGAADGTAVLTVIPKTIAAVRPFVPGLATSNSSLSDDNYNIDRKNGNTVKIGKKNRKGINDGRKKKRKYRRKMRGKMIVPSKPNVTKVSDESVIVSWDLGSGTGIPIRFFKVQYRKMKIQKKSSENVLWKTSEEVIPPHSRDFEVSGLQANYTYRFRVLAVYKNNDNQPGPSSRFFLKKDIELKRPKCIPEIRSLITYDETSVMVKWTLSSKCTDSEIEGFIISYRDATNAGAYTKVTLLGEVHRNYTVRHLFPKVSYDFRINAFNMAGVSGPSKRKTLLHKGTELGTEVTSPVIPVVTRESERTFSHRVLYFAFGTGLGMLIVMVISSYIVYWCRKKREIDPLTTVKFMDTSLRIHRLSYGDFGRCKDVPQGGGNQIPLLGFSQNVLKNQEHPLSNSKTFVNKSKNSYMYKINNKKGDGF